jgi:glycosyltransferase involved in cell wall biosynthesis
MDVTIYTVTYNEELLMQLMIDHYRSRFPNCHIVVYDNQSTDRTVEIAKANNCEIRHYDSGGKVNDQMLWETKNNCWRDAKTDWVIVCDLDEMLDINAEQLKYEHSIGTTKIKCECWHMVNMEDNLDVRSIKYGCRNPNDTVYDKDLMFNKRLVNINYINNDCHFTNSTGVVRDSKPYKMYHYKYVNPDVFVNKQKTSASRLSEINRKNGWGVQCLRDEASLRNEFQQARDAAVRVLPAMNHFYQSIYGWFNYEYLYSDVIKSLPNKAHIVEIGAFKGRSSAFLAVEAINSGKDITIDIIDSWNGVDDSGREPWSDYIDEPDKNQKKPDGDIFEIFKKNLEPVIHAINPIRKTSAEAVKMYKDRSLDFVFVDGNHHYEGVKQDLINWFPKLKEDGIMAGDDYNPSWGVIQAVNEFFGRENIEVVNSQWIVRLKKNTIAHTGYWKTINPFHVMSTPLSDWIINLLKNHKDDYIYDMGCGRGMYLKKMSDAGFNHLVGYEGTIPRNKVFENIHKEDLTVPFFVGNKGHVISLEVAEHIPPQFTDNYLNNVYNTCASGAYFICSWAVRGQGGDGHVNELNNDEAINLITSKGFTFLPEETASARSGILDEQSFEEGHLPWFKNTTLIFKKN